MVAAFDRPDSLKRLLGSLKRSFTPTETTLVISIDHGDRSSTEAVARAFEWDRGPTRVISHRDHLGLKQHILKCGDLTLEYGSIILLEDDLVVSPFFYDYAVQALSRYSEADEIAGISLYNHRYNESANFPFEPLQDGYDNYFLQIASSWGQIWNRRQWSGFRSWLKEAGNPNWDDHIPTAVKNWPNTSWKKDFIAYLVARGMSFVYPRVSLTTNFGDAGTHHDNTNRFQVPLAMGERPYRFSSPKESLAVYDAHCEIRTDVLKRLVPRLRPYDFECDLYGTKDLNFVRPPYVLSSKQGHSMPSFRPVPGISFGLKMKPMEQNMISDVPGTVFRLLEVTPELVEQAPEPSKGEFFEYFRDNRRLIPAEILVDETKRIPRQALVLEVLRRAKNTFRRLFGRRGISSRS